MICALSLSTGFFPCYAQHDGDVLDCLCILSSMSCGNVLLQQKSHD